MPLFYRPSLNSIAKYLQVNREEMVSNAGGGCANTSHGLQDFTDCIVCFLIPSFNSAGNFVISICIPWYDYFLEYTINGGWVGFDDIVRIRPRADGAVGDNTGSGARIRLSYCRVYGFDDLWDELCR